MGTTGLVFRRRMRRITDSGIKYVLRVLPLPGFSGDSTTTPGSNITSLAYSLIAQA
jgi:hypothetical protein